ncbi:MAG: hypothetical protein FGM15_07300 [Chthoniobacterales bacterium]|nr:hypothetical protein [Chthoniobacterales bacterium]
MTNVWIPDGSKDMPFDRKSIAAWVIGTCSTIKTLLAALLKPSDLLRKAEEEGHFITRLALMEEAKTPPFGAVWQEYCSRHNIPGDSSWIAEVKKHEVAILSKRSRIISPK